MAKINELFSSELKVINMGLESFQRDLSDQGVSSVQMNWKPVAGGNERMAGLLDRLKGK